MSRVTYKDWITKDGLLKIESWASDGLLNKDIAANCGVAVGTFNNWTSKFSEVSEALKKGRAPVVREIENALIKKAKGFEYTEEDIYIDIDERGNKHQKVVRHKKYSPPDTSAAIFLLKNYKPNKYRNYNDLTKQQIEAEVRKLRAEASLAERNIEELEGSYEQEVILIDDIPELEEGDYEFDTESEED